MFLHLLYTTKEHVTLRLLEPACSDTVYKVTEPAVRRLLYFRNVNTPQRRLC